MLTRAHVAVLALAAVALTACGSMHPGHAAVVDGEAISMTTFDKTARMYCQVELQLQRQQGAADPTLPNNEVRAHAITDLVTVKVARELARVKGVTPAKKTYQRPADEVATLAMLFPEGDDAETVQSILEDNGEIRAITLALGEQATGLTASETNQEQLFAVGQDAIAKAIKEHDIEISPRLGVSDTLEPVDRTGSVSVSEVGFDAPIGAELPPEQRCA